MALPFGDNVYTKFFTPKEYQVELLDEAKKENIIACVGNVTTKTFIALKLIQDLTIGIRRSRKRNFTLFIAESLQNAAHYASAIKHLTDLNLADFMQFPLPFNDCISEVIALSQVIMVNSSQALELISNNFITLDEIFLLIVDDCYYSTLKSHPLNTFMKLLSNRKNLRIFGMIYPLFTMNDLNPGKIEADLNELQSVMRCRVETASDILSILRYNCKPNEYYLECDIRSKDELDSIIFNEVQDTVEFLQEHRYDPSEIYDGELLEELKSVPNPTEEPLNIIKDFMDILNTMGAWCANKAALSSLFVIEKLKLKTPYERHFLLLCVVSSLMLRIRTIFENYFTQFPEKDQVYKFVSPKVKRLIEILLLYKPSKKITSDTETAEILNQKENEEKQVNEINGKSKPENEESEPSAPLTICDSYIRYKNDKANRWKNKRKFQSKQPNLNRTRSAVDESEVVCSVIFVKSRLIATVVHYLLSDLKKFDGDNFWWLSPQFTTEKTADPEKEPRDAEIQHRNLEDVLRKFRTRECNILIGTSMLEEGIDFPKCNLVIGFDPPSTFRSYIYSKSKASANNANYFLMYEVTYKEKFINDLAKYYEIEQLLLKRCCNKVEKDDDIFEANQYGESIVPYCPSPCENNENNLPYVSLNNAIACINRYCAKLPSDSFTRLTPMWTTKQVLFEGRKLYVTSLHLPINSPYKKEIIGHPMCTEVLSKRLTALEACRLLHLSGELDNNLQPIGKESFHLLFSAEDIVLDECDQLPLSDTADPRPGTNKRRQYYQRKIASCLTDCRPMPNTPLYLYSIKMVLSCPLPEEQNTRGRKIHPPEESPQGFGILLTKKIPKVCPFPIFTRCGEVIVNLELCSDEVYLTAEQLDKISMFLNYTFTKVLRLNKYFMIFDTYNSACTYFIIPTIKTSTSEIIDWDFLDEINKRKEEELKIISDEERKNFQFLRDLYADAVVMPWYRNQDFPQHFYVAEICTNLTPKSKFPGIEYKTFEEYYFRKYQLKIQNIDQPLLDVDHTSARLNFLTPRYVNRKGVALPTCSEATKKAKRESLEQKQILVPELCQVHLFPASLWRKAVALPCILYRLNCLLIAEEIRNKVSHEINLGLNTVPEDFQWPFLNFGWTLADVVKRTRELKEQRALKENAKQPLKLTEIEENGESIEEKEEERYEEPEKTEENECEKDESNSAFGDTLMEIGTWSNEMANDIQSFGSEFDEVSSPSYNTVRYGSPTSWLNHNDDDLDGDSISDSISSHDSFENNSGIRIEFKNEFLAEAVDHIEECTDLDNFDSENTWQWEVTEINENVNVEMQRFEDSVLLNKNKILSSGRIFDDTTKLCLKPVEINSSLKSFNSKHKKLEWVLTPETGYGIQNIEFRQIFIENGVSLLGRNGCNEFLSDEDTSEDDVCLELKKCEIGDWSDDRYMNGFDNYSDPIDNFSFDYQPDLTHHVGPSPSVLLQALTMSNANDGINLERLETIGDSFLKYAITNYLYCTYDNVHEGKLSHIRSKQVSNLHLYKLGKKKVFGECMVACKFEPHDNWLPPCFRIPIELESALIESKISSCFLKVEDLPYLWSVKSSDVSFIKKNKDDIHEDEINDVSNYLPFHLITYHSIPDKSIADCVEALIGAYLISCGIRGAMLFMSWLGIKVLPVIEQAHELNESHCSNVQYGYLSPPSSPLIRNVPNPEEELEQLLVGYEEFERVLGYRFEDRSYLLQAMTHASYSPNRVTDCYQRLEFLGDAVLDYLITRHLYEDKRQHSPGALTDLRSALVNNTIFAALAIRFGFHKYFRHLSPGLADVIHRFVRIQEDNNHAIFEEYYLINEEECEEVEDVEVPKALGDIFESVAGAIFLDSGMSLDAVWRVYYKIMKNEIEQFSTNVPKSPIRELLELEPETAKFGRPEKLADGRRVRVTVEVFGKGIFKGIGRNYRIAKCTAAKCALKQLKKRGLLNKKISNNDLE